MKTVSDISLGSLALLLCAALAVVPLVGCYSFQDDVALVAEIAAVLVPSLMPLSAPLGGVVAVVSVELQDASNALANYRSAEVSLKGQKAAELRAIVSTTQTNLGTLLRDAHVAPEYVQEVTRYVAIVNTVLLAIIAHLPASSSSSARAGSRPLPTVKASSAADLKQAWNSVAVPAHQLQ